MGLVLSARDVDEVFLELAIDKNDNAGIILALDSLLAFDLNQKPAPTIPEMPVYLRGVLEGVYHASR